MTLFVIILSCLAALYVIKYYLLNANLKKAQKELEEIKQNPEANRILLFSHPNKDAERLLSSMNEYILLCRERQIASMNRERDLRAEIENISHDLRTPLTSILGYLDLIDKASLGEEDRENIEIIERKARALQRLIGNFYDLSRLELNDYQLSMEPIELTRYAKEILLTHFQEFENRHLDIRLDLSENPVYVMADSGALERIFTNLVQNALRYAETNFTVSITEIDGTAKITFGNDTSVLTAEDASHLFERFYVKDSSRTAQSTGLGLTISKLLTEAMGGTAAAELTKKQIQFIFTLQTTHQ